MTKLVTLPSIEFVLYLNLKEKGMPSEQQVKQYLADNSFCFDSVHTAT